MARNKRSHLLVIRFSALGDILMTLPVLEELALKEQDLTITLLSRPYVGPLSALLPENVRFVGINPRNYKGLRGLFRMFLELKSLGVDHVADLHDVIRTKVLRLLFRLWGIPVSRIRKDRAARKRFLKSKEKVQQKTSFEKYAEALKEASHPVTLDPTRALALSGKLRELSLDVDIPPRSVGIAPFAAHKGKIYPLDKMEEVISILVREGISVFLLGAGKEERAILEEWQERHPLTLSLAGKLPDMAHEAAAIQRMGVFLAMDSGNMHLAALTGVPLLSLWGATHPKGGFLSWGSKPEDVIDVPLPCRPCSIYGKKPCVFGDYRCLSGISPAQVADRILSRLKD